MNCINAFHANYRFLWLCRALLWSGNHEAAGQDRMTIDEFSGQVALITAAAAGIGQAIAGEWTRRGGVAVVTDTDEQGAAATVRALTVQGRTAFAIGMNVASRADIERGTAWAIEKAGGIDVLFNVAGINIPKNIEEMQDDEWGRVFEVNVTSVYRASRLVIPQMRRRGGGAIVNVSSVAGVLAEGRCGAYSASKGAVIQLTRNMALDFAKDNIRVNAICPGSTRTPRTENYWKKSSTGKSELAEVCPMRRSAEPEEIARPAVFLASRDASYITGSTLVVDGGLTAGFRVPSLEKA
jgi:NAD(P)-dependent dehydrogenase (short-subunit alcohol dehydrogenase family)